MTTLAPVCLLMRIESLPISRPPQPLYPCKWQMVISDTNEKIIAHHLGRISERLIRTSTVKADGSPGPTVHLEEVIEDLTTEHVYLKFDSFAPSRELALVITFLVRDFDITRISVEDIK